MEPERFARMPITKERVRRVVEAGRVAVDEALALRRELTRLAAEDVGNTALMMLLHSSLEGSFRVKEAEIVIKEEEKWVQRNWKAMESKKRYVERKRARAVMAAEPRLRKELGLSDDIHGPYDFTLKPEKD